MQTLEISSRDEVLNRIFQITDELHGFLLRNKYMSQVPPLNYLARNGHRSTMSEIELLESERQLSNYLQLLVSAEKEGVSLRSAPELTKYWLRLSGLETRSEFFDNVTVNSDVIEGYTDNHIQVFRNLSFMKLCGYSLAEVFTHAWPELFERSQVITETGLSDVLAAMREKRVVKASAPAHYMKERFSCDRRIHKVQFGHIAPTFKDGVVVGYLVASRGKVLDRPDRHELRFI